MIPADLLQQLQEKDPETWKRAQSIRHFLKPHNSEAAVGAWLLYCIMRAIRARGWWYQIAVGYGGVIQAVVYCSEVGLHKGDTEAEALLRAYLAALETVPSHDSPQTP